MSPQLGAEREGGAGGEAGPEAGLAAAGASPPRAGGGGGRLEGACPGVAVLLLGASGDLSRRKCLPALARLARRGLAPALSVVGAARSDLGQAGLEALARAAALEAAAQLRRVPTPGGQSPEAFAEDFAARCRFVHCPGGYGDGAATAAMGDALQWADALAAASGVPGGARGRLIYFALPPSAYEDTMAGLGAAGLLREDEDLWVRAVLEKPFGRDSDEARQLIADLAHVCPEHQICRMDHYLGKEMVENLLTLRFDNAWLEPTLNRHHVSSVQITLRETLLCEGRAGYFDHYGIIRDVIQNHLTQVLALFAMERPVTSSGDDIRNEKVKVLRQVRVAGPEDCVVGQYEGYLNEPGVPPGSRTPTYAVCVVWIDNERWSGVPFIFKASKAADKSKAEIRVQYRAVARPLTLDCRSDEMRNELVVRVQPSLAIYMKTVVKRPGLSMEVDMKELDLTFKQRDPNTDTKDAYEQLMLQAFQGHMHSFVRGDEVIAAWDIFTPLLHAIEEGVVPMQSYTVGTRGPAAGDAMVAELGFRRGEDYAWRSFSQRGTPRITPRATPKGSPQISRSPSAKRLDLSPGGVPLKSGPGGSNGNTPPRADGLPPRSPARGLAPSP